MSDPRYAETHARLENLRRRGYFDVALDAIRAGRPLLESGPISLAKGEQALSAGRGLLESVMPPPMLEAIVRIAGRPPLRVTNGRVENLYPIPPDLPPDLDLLIGAVEGMTAAVGRVEFINHDSAWGGTAWIVDKTADGYLVVTNRHVAEVVARRVRGGAGVFLFNPFAAVRYGAAIDFADEPGTGVARLAHVNRFTLIAAATEADVAVAAITTPETFELEPLRLADADPKHGEPVAVIGYPAADGVRNDPTHMEQYFRGLYDVKRFSPGLTIKRSEATVLSHDCTTLGGNSGSPLICLKSGLVVGLHFGGRFGVGNVAIPVTTLHTMLRGDAPGVFPGADLTNDLGEEELADRSNISSHFAGRPGYDPAFLGAATDVPLPSIPSASFDLVTPPDATRDRPSELRYRHFGVLYCTKYRSPVVTAVNIDATRYRPIKRGRDRWFFDERVPRGAQMKKADFSAAGVHRGHLVRRAEVAWGDDDVTAEEANLDSFHYSNATPQHPAFNTGSTLWLGLENYILHSARTHGFRACVLSGPVLNDDTPAIEEPAMTLPLEYWKLVAMLTRAESGGEQLHVTAYLLSQGNLIYKLMAQRGLREALEGFAFGAYRTYQLPVSELEAATGYDFRHLRVHDPLAAIATEESLRASQLYRVVDTLEDLTL